MNEDAVSRAEHNVNGVDVSQNKADQNFSGHTEVHVHIVHSLRENRLASSFGGDVVKELAHKVGIEIGRLGIFDALSGKTDRAVGVWRNLLHPALSKGKNSTEPQISMAFHCAHPQIPASLLRVQPVNQHSLAIKIAACFYGSTADIPRELRIPKVGIGGVVDILGIVFV